MHSRYLQQHTFNHSYKTYFLSKEHFSTWLIFVSLSFIQQVVLPDKLSAGRGAPKEHFILCLDPVLYLCSLLAQLALYYIVVSSLTTL